MKKMIQIYKKLEDIKYGWFDKNKNLHDKLYKDYFKLYKMQSIEEINKSRIGVCWETVELSRHLLEQAGYKCTSYFAIYNDIGYFCHTCLVVEKENCFYWFEVSFNEKKGIKKYENLNKLYEDIMYNYYS